MAYILHIEVAVNNFESYALSRNEKTFMFSLGCEYEILAGKMFVSSRRESIVLEGTKTCSKN